MADIFDSFPCVQATDGPLFTCRLGTWARPAFLPRYCQEQPEIFTQPVPGEDYFEWSDLLEAVTAAGDTFTFLEIGAGYGRWSSRAAAAAKHLGKRVNIGLKRSRSTSSGLSNT